MALHDIWLDLGLVIDLIELTDTSIEVLVGWQDTCWGTLPWVEIKLFTLGSRTTDVVTLTMDRCPAIAFDRNDPLWVYQVVGAVADFPCRLHHDFAGAPLFVVPFVRDWGQRCVNTDS